MTDFIRKILVLITHKENSKLTRLEERILYFLLKRDSYGSEIREAILEVTEGEIYLVDGTLYPALQQLEKMKLLESYWEEKNLERRRGKRRRMYTITPKGTNAIQKEENVRLYLRDWEKTCKG